MSNMKTKDFRDGMRVTCEICGDKIDDAKLAKASYGNWLVCQNVITGNNEGDLKGYKYGWWFDPESAYQSVTNLRPGKQSHHRKPSPDSELVGSCTLLKKWKWRAIDIDGGDYVYTHKPAWNPDGKCGDNKTVTTDSMKCNGLLPRLSTKGIKPSLRIYRRQGDKWVHVG